MTGTIPSTLPIATITDKAFVFDACYIGMKTQDESALVYIEITADKMTGEMTGELFSVDCDGDRSPWGPVDASHADVEKFLAKQDITLGSPVSPGSDEAHVASDIDLDEMAADGDLVEVASEHVSRQGVRYRIISVRRARHIGGHGSPQYMMQLDGVSWDYCGRQLGAYKRGDAARFNNAGEPSMIWGLAMASWEAGDRQWTSNVNDYNNHAGWTNCHDAIVAKMETMRQWVRFS